MMHLGTVCIPMGTECYFSRRLEFLESTQWMMESFLPTMRTKYNGLKKSSYNLKDPQPAAVTEKKENSLQRLKARDLKIFSTYSGEQFTNMLLTILNATLVIQKILLSSATEKPKRPQLETRHVSLEYTKCYLKSDILYESLSPVKTSTRVEEKLKLTIWKTIDSKLVPEACSKCQEVISKKLFFDERRFGLLNNCDHAFCYGCIRDLCDSDGHEEPFYKRAALGPVRCPECDEISDRVAASSNWISGESKVEFFKAFNKNVSSGNMIKQINESYYGLDNIKIQNDGSLNKVTSSDHDLMIAGADKEEVF
ncbi:uncharacterized protein NPIL_511611 [Nephila pilipes]|uniref:RING-type domain-containing protein n=1 Tax=Nephila pilipes TaxID=299642 RepID=A0A8X6QP94_NEPPI|nr:uncharacterized protein NPIL_511611 [Nephila pilipes]